MTLDEGGELEFALQTLHRSWKKTLPLQEEQSRYLGGGRNCLRDEDNMGNVRLAPRPKPKKTSWH